MTDVRGATSLAGRSAEGPTAEGVPSASTVIIPLRSWDDPSRRFLRRPFRFARAARGEEAVGRFPRGLHFRRLGVCLYLSAHGVCLWRMMGLVDLAWTNRSPSWVYVTDRWASHGRD